MSRPTIGEFLREQRRTAELSLRQLSDLAGVSNPYLSQIERGLRKPSADVLQQLAKALRISSEALYVRAGLLDPPQPGQSVEDAVLADPSLEEQHKKVLLDVYYALRSTRRDGHPENDSQNDPENHPER